MSETHDVPEAEIPVDRMRGLEAAFRDGDAEAFKTLVMRHERELLNILTGRCKGNRERAKDVMQEALLSAWNSRARFDPAKARFRTWLYAIAARRTIDSHRQISRHPEPQLAAIEDEEGTVSTDALVADTHDDYAEADARLDGDRQRQALVDALDELNPRQAMAIVLTTLEGMTNDEAAVYLGAVNGDQVAVLKTNGKNRLMQIIHGSVA